MESFAKMFADLLLQRVAPPSPEGFVFRRCCISTSNRKSTTIHRPPSGIREGRTLPPNKTLKTSPFNKVTFKSLVFVVHRWNRTPRPQPNTVSFHNFKSQNFKLSVSNPKSKYVAYLSVLYCLKFQIARV